MLQKLEDIPEWRKRRQEFAPNSTGLICRMTLEAMFSNAPYANKPRLRPLIRLLQPLPIPNQVWEDIALDFITGLPPSFGYSIIMVVVDRLSKFGHFIPMKLDFNSRSVAEAFVTNIVKLYGIPKAIVSDGDKAFLSTFWQQLFKL